MEVPKAPLRKMGIPAVRLERASMLERRNLCHVILVKHGRDGMLV